MHDLIITGGSVVDGSGAPARRADVAISGSRVAAVGDIGAHEAHRVLDAGGLVVTPGFVDIHSHSDLTILINPRAESKIRQGVTTEVIGNCGITAAPLTGAHRDELLDFLSVTFGTAGSDPRDWAWESFGDWLDHLRQQALGINLAPLVGHTTLRIAAMGGAHRPARESELEAMEALLDRCLSEGAFGLSSGLEYPPAASAGMEELIRLARVAAAHDCLYATHARNEDLFLFDAIAEAVEVARQSGCRLEISHLKAGGVQNWGQAPRLLAYLDAARERGLEVMWDQYPYVAWGSSLIDYLPHHVAEHSTEELPTLLRDASARQAIRNEIKDAVESGRHPLCAAPWDTVRIALVRSEANRPLEGRTVAAIAHDQGRDPLDVALDLLADEQGAVKTLVFCVSEEDIATIMQHPLTAIATDGRAVAPYGLLGRGKIHPRYYGTFPRVLGRYVRERGLLTLESAVKKMTRLPASRVGLHDRGLVAPGMVADLVILDPETISDRATFEQPHRYSTGIAWVVLGGQVVVDHGEHTGTLCGQVLSPA